MKKTKILAIVLVLAMLFQIMPVMTLGVSAAGTDTIVLYPEFPEEIKRDNMYHVYISQGGEEYELPVYNSMTHSNYNVRDQYGTYSEADRRFCQFSATPSEDNPVTIKVVSNADFSKASVIPSINGNGFYSTRLQCYLPFDMASEEEAEWLRAYEILQYNNLFDRNNRSKALFASAEEKD